MTLKAKIEDIVGTYPDTDALDNWLNEGAKKIVNLMSEGNLNKLADSFTDSGSGVSLADKRLLRAHKSNYGATLLDARYKAQVQDSASLHYATSKDPVAIIDGKLIYIYPSGGTVIAVTYPLLDSSAYFAGDFEEFIEGAVLYAAFWASVSKINGLITTLNGLSFSDPSSVSAPSAPSYTFTDIEIPLIALTDIGSLGTAPTYTKPTIGTGSSSLPSNLDLSGIAIPVAPTMSLTSISAATVASIGTLSLTGTPPTYDDTIEPTPSFTDYDTAMTDEDIDLASGHLSKIEKQLQKYQTDTYNQLNEFNSELEAYKGDIQKDIEQWRSSVQTKIKDAELSNSAKSLTLQKELGDYSNKLQAYSSDISNYGARVNAEVNEFVNNLQKYTGENRLIIDEYIADIQNEQAEFNKELQIYQSTVQKAIEQARIYSSEKLAQLQIDFQVASQNAFKELERQIAEYSAKLSKYQSDIADYGAKTNQYAQKFGAQVQQKTTEIQSWINLSGLIESQFNKFLGTI